MRAKPDRLAEPITSQAQSLDNVGKDFIIRLLGIIAFRPLWLWLIARCRGRTLAVGRFHRWLGTYVGT